MEKHGYQSECESPVNREKIIKAKNKYGVDV